MSSLPKEIMEDILERLPVKSLMRFRCVNKPFCTLIRSKYFVRKHLMRSVKNDNTSLLLHGNHINRHNKMYLLDPKSLSLSLSSSTTYEIVKAAPLCYPSISLEYTIDIMGSCDGLVCLNMNGCGICDIIFLWNPSTREYKKLPSSPTRASKPHASVFGFGYDSSIDDYKLVKVLFDESADHSKVDVYTLESNSWRTVDTIPWSLDKSKPGVFAYGALYWFAIRLTDGSVFILRFDLTNETFREIPLPPSDHEESLQGVECKRIMEVLLGRGPKWSFETGEILLQKRGGLILSNPMLGSEKLLTIQGTIGLRTTVPYVPCLISLNSGTYVERRKYKRKSETCRNLKENNKKEKRARQ